MGRRLNGSRDGSDQTSSENPVCAAGSLGINSSGSFWGRGSGGGDLFSKRSLPRPSLLPLLLSLFVFTPALLALWAGPAHAMHIAEGILPLPWAAFWFAVSLPFVGWGLRELRIKSQKDPQFKPLVGLVGAAVFVISCMPIPVPTAGTCSHPCATGMAAIIVGPFLSVALASVALTLQALFLAHGGLTTLGANIFSMGVVGSFTGYGAFILARRLGASWAPAAFLAGVVSDWATYAATALSLTAALHTDGAFGTMFLTILAAFVPTQVPLGILEGFLCAGAYKFLLNRRPEFLAARAEGGLA